METNKIALKQMLETKDAVIYLKDLIKSFNAGKVVVQQGEKYVDLQVPEMVDIKVEAKVKKDKSKFSLELSWHNVVSEPTESVTITSNTPSDLAPAAHQATTPAAKQGQKAGPTAPSTTSAGKDDKVYFGPGSRKQKKTPAKPAAVQAKTDAAEPTSKASPKAKKSVPNEPTSRK